jgi:glyoxylase-like metal-dependent hydrolase (beta-lactamase superfamily II)
MPIAANVEALDLPMQLTGAPSSVHPTLVWDEEDAVLIDSGFRGQLEQLRAEVEGVGLTLARLTKLIVTHQDIDHIGGIDPLLAEEGDHIEVLAHELDRPYITGEKRLLKADPERMAQLAERLTSLPEEQRQAMIDAFENTKARVDGTVSDGERLPWCGGITVIHTPGHTPGHICLYLEASRVLVAGDALNVWDGRLVGPSPQSADDIGQAVASLQKLAPYEIETVVCYHGGPYTGDVNARIAELAAAPPPASRPGR